MSLWRCSFQCHVDWICVEQCWIQDDLGVFEGAGLLWLPAAACDFKMRGTQLQAHIKHLPGVDLAPSLYQRPAFSGSAGAN